jgi:acylphosphatase
MIKTISITVTGKVQGVYYRQRTTEQASLLQITGTVRNLPDGNVQVIATGAPVQLEQLIAWCRQGPPRAQVTGISVSNLPTEHFEDFRIVR